MKKMDIFNCIKELEELEMADFICGVPYDYEIKVRKKYGVPLSMPLKIRKKCPECGQLHFRCENHKY